LELAYNGLVHYVNTAGQLKTINPCNLAVVASPVTATLAQCYYAGGGPSYLLPDQLDGEDYQSVPNTAAPYLNSSRIDNQYFTMGAARRIYTCNPLALQATLLGVSDLKVSLIPSNSAGAATGGAICATNWESTLRPEVRTLCSSFLANPANAGYYLIKVEGRNVCGQVVQQTGRFLLSSISPASVSLSFNPCTGTGIPALTTSEANPAEIGVYGGGIDIGFTTGTYDDYEVRFEELIPASGTAAAYYVPRGTVFYRYNTSGTATTTIGLNGLSSEADLGNGYFTPSGAGYNRVFRLTLLVSNECGTVPVQGYFRASNLTCRPVSGPAASGVSVYPNPLQRGAGRFTFTLPSAQRVHLTIVDGLTGQERLVLLRGADYQAGTHTLSFDASRLPQGVYLYRFVADNEVQVGRLLQPE
jgi:hypothetical protein